MESVLIIITLVSLAMTVALGAVLAKLMRDDRRRSDARVALLREMADAMAHQQEAVEPRPRATVAVETARIEHVKARDIAPVARWEAPRLTADDLDLTRTGDVDVQVADLFVRPEPRSAWPRRLAVAASIALLVSVAVMALGSRPTFVDPAAPAATRPVSAQTSGLLELVSLKQAQETDALTITGLVQNPRDGAILSKVTATALLFAADGTFLASGRAPLDFTVLRPGDESGFVISVPVAAPVARYRVGFRSEDGQVIGHVDRRTSPTMTVSRSSVPLTTRGAS